MDPTAPRPGQSGGRPDHPDNGYPTGGYQAPAPQNPGVWDRSDREAARFAPPQPAGAPHGEPHYGQPTQAFAAPGTDRTMARAQVMAQGVARQVRSMPWQERVIRAPGVAAVVAGILTLLSLVFPWMTLVNDDMWNDPLYRGAKIGIGPFRLPYLFGGEYSILGESMDFDEELVSTGSVVTLGILVTFAALCMLIGGFLLARATLPELGAGLVVAALTSLGWARLPFSITNNLLDLARKDSVFHEDFFDGELGRSVIVRSGIGLHLTTLALWLLALALLVFLGMVVYREIIRIRRWLA